MPIKDKKKRKEKAKEYSRKHYLANKQAVKERAKKHTKKKRKEHSIWAREYKSKKGCCVCGENRPACLVFHHRDENDKIGCIPTLINRGWGFQRILKEVEKCDVMCANCHRQLHWNIRNGLE